MQYKDITSYNKIGIPNGYWEKYYPYSDRLFFTCYYINFEEYGYEEIYDTKGIIRDKRYYAR